MSDPIRAALPGVAPPLSDSSAPRGGAPGKATFKDILARKRESLKFSSHASERLSLRNIQFSEEDLKTIGEMAERAREKGGQDSLLLFKDLALIVNLPHNTVVTVIAGPHLKEHVFTQIDCAVVS